MRRFYTIVAGNTLGAHHAFIRRLEVIGQTEVTSPGSCDYFLVFCPIVSRVGTDITEAMEKIPRRISSCGTPAILVVMHHTINADTFVSDSSRHVTRKDIILTVDCLFHEGHFLDCNRNEKAFSDVRRVLGYKVHIWNSLCNWLRNKGRKYFLPVTLVIALSGLLLFSVVWYYAPALYPPLMDL